jgi:C_GCAxxG_C_C family probable redox protein
MINIPVKDKRKGTTIMESRVEQAAERKMCGYNCAQAVACTYCDLAGIDEETVRNLTQGFAAGIGGSMEATCGAVIGAVNILGLINKNPQRTMQGSRRIINRFKLYATLLVSGLTMLLLLTKGSDLISLYLTDTAGNGATDVALQYGKQYLVIMLVVYGNQLQQLS